MLSPIVQNLRPYSIEPQILILKSFSSMFENPRSLFVKYKGNPFKDITDYCTEIHANDGPIH
jgi:hypothetical protein